MRQVSQLKQLGIVLSTQLALMVLVGLAVVITNQSLGKNDQPLALALEPVCVNNPDRGPAQQTEQQSKLPSARGGSFRFLAF